MIKEHKKIIDDAEFSKGVNSAGLEKAKSDETKSQEAKDKEAEESEKKGQKAVANADKKAEKSKD